MLNHRRFFKYRFLIVISAMLVIIIMMIGLALFTTRNDVPAKSDQAAGQSANGLPLTATQRLTFLQNEQSVTSEPIPLNIPAFTQTSSSLEWKPLPALLESDHGLITNGERSEYKVALTFDVCQAEGELSGYDAGIVRVLNETQTPATFFLGGEWMRDHQSQTRELASNPLFELGNHSWSHPDLSTLGPDEIKQEIVLTQQEMFSLLNYQTNLFRLPFGTYNEDTLNAINDNGLYVIQWSIVSGDPDPNIDAVRMTNWVLQQIQPGSIIIMHANGRGWHTAEALPGIIQSIRQQGFTLVTVSELIKIPPYK